MHEHEERRHQQPLTVNVQCSCCADTQREILALVRDIKRLQGGHRAGSHRLAHQRSAEFGWAPAGALPLSPAQPPPSP